MLKWIIQCIKQTNKQTNNREKKPPATTAPATQLKHTIQNCTKTRNGKKSSQQQILNSMDMDMDMDMERNKMNTETLTQLIV